MKKILCLVAMFLVTIVLSSCELFGDNKTEQPTNNPTESADEVAPEINGVPVMITATQGDVVNLLDGVTAVDDVDGDITDKITISITPEIAVVDGACTPTETGSYEVKYEVADTAGNIGNAYAELSVIQKLADAVVYKEYTFADVDASGYGTYFNEAVVGTAAIVKGNYQINVTQSSGTDWHIKFEKSIVTKPGSDYKLSYEFTSSVAGAVMLNGERIEIQAGSNTVSKTILAVEGESLYTELQFGLLQGPFTVDISKVSVEEITGTDIYTDITPSSFAYVQDEQAYSSLGGNAEATFSRTDTSATLNITRAGDANGGRGGVWESRIYLKPGMDLAAGKKYRISVDVEATNPYSVFEVCYNNGDNEKGVGALYGQSLAAGEKKTLTITVALEENKDNLVIMFQIGELAEGVTSNTFTVSNLVVEEISGDKISETTSVIFTPEGFGTYNDGANGANGYLYSENGKLVYEMTSIGLTDWHNKMYVEKITLEADKYYTIKFTAKADKEISCALFLNVFGKWDPRLSATVNFTTEEQTFEFKVDKAFAAEMNFEILWQFGSEANQALGGAKIEFTSIQILAQDAQ